MTEKKSNNFYKNVIDLKKGDILFFDTNALMALIIEENSYHLAVKHFIVHAISCDCELYVSNTVYKELLYVLARELYCQHCVSTGEQTRESAKSNWPKLPKSPNHDERNLVKKFNTLAIEKIHLLTSIFDFTDSTVKIYEYAFEYASKYNLHSTDAFIASYTHHLNASLVSLDQDFNQLTEFNTYYAHKEGQKFFNEKIYDHVEFHDEFYKIVNELLPTNEPLTN